MTFLERLLNLTVFPCTNILLPKILLEFLIMTLKTSVNLFLMISQSQVNSATTTWTYHPSMKHPFSSCSPMKIPATTQG